MPDVAAERPRTDAEQRTDGGALMARTLRERGVTTVFALPGGHILPFLDACIDEDIRVIDTRHEGAAVLAAEGWALATGDTGVAAVTAGPGFANGLIGLLDAGDLERAAGDAGGPHQPHPPGPRGGRGRRPARDRGSDREVGGELHGRRDGYPRYVAEAMHRARSGCPGAVYLEVDSHAVYGKAAPLDSRADRVLDARRPAPPALRPTSVPRSRHSRPPSARSSSPGAARSGPAPAPRSHASPRSPRSR